ncbi:MAG: hypothetical protein HYZ45_11120 [Burkholderiales bacterium]|nr:hypothetical protein [Burkholderiales bacterium]
MRTSLISLAIAALALSPAWAASPAKKTSPEIEAVKKAIGKASCDSNDQCKAVPMGAKACGGPEFFLAYSTKGEHAAKIPDLATNHRIAREKEIAANGEMSDCKMLTDPGAQCVANKCVLKPEPKASASASAS